MSEVFEGNLTCLTKQDLGRKLSCGLISDRCDFVKYAQMDNFECCTIMLKPEVWEDDSQFRSRMYHYCSYNQMNYYLVPEVGVNSNLNLHYHGLISFSNYQNRRRFVSWLNKNWGKFYCSTKTDVNNWYNYVHKGVKEQSLYLFDKEYEVNIPT